MFAWIWVLRHSHGAWPWRETGETVYHEECIYTARCTAIALQSIHLFQESLYTFSPAHPLPIYT